MSAERDPVVTLHRVTFRVPAQRFRTHFSITRESTLAVVDEFALRLVAVCGTVEPAELTSFFGFDAREGAEVLRGLVSRDFLAAPQGQLALTESGRALFPQGIGASPRLIEVAPRTDTIQMDLLDFRLVEELKGDPSMGVGIRLELPHSFRASESPDTVARAFRDQFGAYATTRGLNRDARLYGIASVEPKARFELPIDLNVNLREGAVASIELDIGRDQDSVLGRKVQEWFSEQCGHPLDDGAAWDFLRSLLPELGEHPPSLAQASAFRLRSRGPDVVGLVGAISVPSVLETVTSFVETAASGPTSSGFVCWLPAESGFWFRSRAAWSAVDSLRDATDEERAPLAVLVLRATRPEDDLRLLRKRFDDVVLAGAGVPPGVEIVLAPHGWCAVWAWVRVDGPGVPVPVGFVTTRASIVERLTGTLSAAPGPG
ncbi:hypothetical protein [Sorangium sp. So ce1024]|uniref:hypothetical protein n=1 Tax=Sorangium sp. So ce1024 TaxID=3133327 RepID=UPI003F07874B